MSVYVWPSQVLPYFFLVTNIFIYNKILYLAFLSKKVVPAVKLGSSSPFPPRCAASVQAYVPR